MHSLCLSKELKHSLYNQKFMGKKQQFNTANLKRSNVEASLSLSPKEKYQSNFLILLQMCLQRSCQLFPTMYLSLHYHFLFFTRCSFAPLVAD